MFSGGHALVTGRTGSLTDLLYQPGPGSLPDSAYQIKGFYESNNGPSVLASPSTSGRTLAGSKQKGVLRDPVWLRLIPKQYVPGSAAPFIVGADGPDRALFIALDNLIAERRVPVMVAISIGNGGGDAQATSAPRIRYDVRPLCGVRGD